MKKVFILSLILAAIISILIIGCYVQPKHMAKTEIVETNGSDSTKTEVRTEGNMNSTQLTTVHESTILGRRPGEKTYVRMHGVTGGVINSQNNGSKKSGTEPKQLTRGQELAKAWREWRQSHPHTPRPNQTWPDGYTPINWQLGDTGGR